MCGKSFDLTSPACHWFLFENASAGLAPRPSPWPRVAKSFDLIAWWRWGFFENASAGLAPPIPRAPDVANLTFTSPGGDVGYDTMTLQASLRSFVS